VAFAAVSTTEEDSAVDSAVDSTTEVAVGSAVDSVVEVDLTIEEGSDSNPMDMALALLMALHPVPGVLEAGIAATAEVATAEEMAEADTTIATVVEVAVRTTTEVAVEHVEAAATVNLLVRGAAVKVGMAAETKAAVVAETKGEGAAETTPTGNDPTTATNMTTGTNEGTELNVCSISMGKPGLSVCFLSLFSLSPQGYAVHAVSSLDTLVVTMTLKGKLTAWPYCTGPPTFATSFTTATA
jgi:hypothetical protein